ncbi:MAG: shikimate dehydrogenase [bacterium]
MNANISSRPRLAVIGDPISHSLSPALQGFLIQYFNLSFTYEAVRVSARALPAFIKELRAGNFSGANVTIPHKQAVMPLLDDLSETASQIGAVNTITSAAGLLTGHNTDAPGFLRAVQGAEIELKNQKVLILGAGGAATAVLHVLLEAGASTIYLCNRSDARAEKLRGALSDAHQDKLRVITWDDRGNWLQTRPVTVIVNTTSAGMPPQQQLSPLPKSALYEALTLIDLIYNPMETVLLREAKQAGAKTLNGLAMLIYQGVAALELWSRQKLETGGIYGEIEKHLLAQMSNR